MEKYRMRSKEFYDKKAKGEKVSSNYEYASPRLYVVEFDTGMTHEVMATSARDAKLKTLHLQSDYGYYKTAYQKKGCDCGHNESCPNCLP